MVQIQDQGHTSSTAKQQVHFKLSSKPGDPWKLSLPFEKCSSLKVNLDTLLFSHSLTSIKSTRNELINTIPSLVDYEFSFWVGNVWISSIGWKDEVKSDTYIVLKRMPTPLLFVPPPSPSKRPETSFSDVKALQHPSHIYTATGLHKPPYSGCDESVFRFWGSLHATGLFEMEIYRQLRLCAPSGRWAGLDGDVVKTGTITALDHPDACFGRVLADTLTGGNLPLCWHIVILKAKISKGFRDKEEGAHLHGDSVYRWDRYPSRKHAEVGLREAFCSSYSIMAEKVSTGHQAWS